jgi:hypothetical protein
VTRDGGYDGDLSELMKQDDKMVKEEKNLIHDNIKEDNGGDNGHKITINCCDGNAWRCAALEDRAGQHDNYNNN